MGFDSDGRHAYVANSEAQCISQYSVKSDGTLAPLAASYSLKGMAPHDVVLARPGHFAYVLSCDGSAIVTLHVDADGKLGSILPTMTRLVTPQGMVMSHSGRYLYIVDDEALCQYSLSDTGQVVPLTPASVRPGPGPMAVAATSDGRFVYVANNAEGSISQFSVRGDGTLDTLAPPSVPTGKWPTSIAIARRVASGAAGAFGGKGKAP